MKKSLVSKNYPLMIVKQPIEQPPILGVEYGRIFIERADYFQNKLDELITFHVKSLATDNDDLVCLKNKFISNIPLLAEDEIKEIKESDRISDSIVKKCRPVMQYCIENIDTLSETDMGEISSPAILFSNCTGVSLTYRLLGIMLSRPLRIPIDYIRKLEKASYVTLQKMGEYVGYWTARRREQQRNTIGAKQMTKNKEKRMNDLKPLIRKFAVDLNDRNSIKKFIPKAMEHLEKGERTIIKYLDSILQSETGKITE